MLAKSTLPHPRVAFPEDLASTLDRHLSHEGQSEGFELLGEVLAASFPRRGHTIHFAVAAPASPWQCTHDHTLLVEDIRMPPLHRFHMVVTDHRGSCPSTFLRPQLGRFPQLQEKCGGLPAQTATPPPSSSSQAPATVQRSVTVSSIAIIRHPSSPPSLSK